MIIATQKMFSSKVNISVDYEQEQKLFSDSRLKDETGKVVSFNTVIDALNYMAQQGRFFVNAYPLSVQGGGTVLNYIMRKKVP